MGFPDGLRRLGHFLVDFIQYAIRMNWLWRAIVSLTGQNRTPSSLTPLVVDLFQVRGWSIIRPGHQFGHGGLQCCQP